MFINQPESLGFIYGGPFEIFPDKSDMDFCKKTKKREKIYTLSAFKMSYLLYSPLKLAIYQF